MSENLLDVSNTTIPGAVRWVVEHHGGTEAIVDGDERFDFVELGRRVDEVARSLIASGVEPGDRIALWAPNTWRWIVVALGVHAAGATLVPINTRFKAAEAAYVITRSAARMLFTETDFLGVDYVEMIGGTEVACLEELVVIGGPTADGATSYDAFLERGSSIDAAVAADRSAAVAPTDLALIMFTSGTTGDPKGVMLTHGPVVRAFDAWATCGDLRAGDRFLIVNPLFHAFGFSSCVISSLVRGCTMFPLPVFDVDAVMSLIEREQISMLPGPPTIYQSMLNAPNLADFDLSSLKRAVTGAASIPTQLVVDMRERLGIETVITAYGMTETSGISAMCRPDDDDETIASTSGRALPDVEMKIVDAEGNLCPAGTDGELFIRGYQVMSGYLDDPVRTDETIDADGWLHTGDIGVLDERGYLDITDRKKDMFICGGFNAYPAEIERMMLERDDLAQAAVIGLPDDRLGEVGAAFVIPRVGTSPDPTEIVEWCRANMANYKAPRQVWIVDDLPLTASGKVRKGDLRDTALGTAEG